MLKENQNLLSTNQAALYLNISPKTLANSRSQGTGVIINFCKIGGKINYKKSDLDAYIEANTFTNNGKAETINE